jgi:chromosomal replication initiation ATPase DnaA
MTVISQIPIPFEQHISYAAEDFIVGEANRHATEVLSRFPDWPEPVMAIYGPQACGKTHLAHRVAQQFGGVFVSEALGKSDAASLAERAPLLVVDGWDNEAALAQLINHCRAQKHALLITSSVAPARASVALPDLRSRLSAIVALEMSVPDEALLAALLTKHFADRQIRVAPEVITYIVSRMERSYHAAATAATWLDAKALEAGRAITLPLARMWLEHEK